MSALDRLKCIQNNFRQQWHGINCEISGRPGEYYDLISSLFRLKQSTFSCRVILVLQQPFICPLANHGAEVMKNLMSLCTSCFAIHYCLSRTKALILFMPLCCFSMNLWLCFVCWVLTCVTICVCEDERHGKLREPKTRGHRR